MDISFSKYFTELRMGLSEEIRGKLIDKVDVFSDNRMESCWNFEVVFWVRNYVQVW